MDAKQIESLRLKLANILANIPNLLLVRLRSLGDAILTLPLIEALHEWRPELRLDVLIEEPYAPVFKSHPAINEVLTLRARKHASVRGRTRLQAIREIRSRHYAAVLNLHGGTTSMFFTAFARAEIRIGQKNHRGASWLYTVQIPPSTAIWQRTAIHTVEHQLSLMRWLGIPISPEARGAIHVDPEAAQRIQDRLARAGISDYILMQPTATLKTKQWSATKFAALGDRLFKRYGIPIIYTAAANEALHLQRVKEAATAGHIYWSDLALEDLFALINGCRLFVGNDSGPTHAASALKKPVVVIWGSSDFQVWRPWDCQYEAVRSSLPCMPCLGYKCSSFDEPKCIVDITVVQVFEACERLLSRI